MYAGIAVNGDGVVGIEWFPGQGCPVFVVSTDGGSSVTDPRPLGSCGPNRDVSAVRWAMETNLNTYNDRSPVDHPLVYSRSEAPGFSVRAAAGTLGSVRIAADSAGAFHPFWTEPRWDGIKTFTARVTIGREPQPRVSVAEMEETTKEFAVRVANVKFDPLDATLNMDISVRNIASAAVAYPLLLEAFADHSDCGAVRYLNSWGTSELGRPVFRVPQRPDRRQLFPGEDSLASHLLVAVDGCLPEKLSVAGSARQNAIKARSFFPVAVRFHIYCQRKEFGNSPEPW